jgi:arylsulfatase A-like enzyme
MIRVAMAAGLPLLLAAAACAPPAGPSPDIVVIMVDTLRADYTGPYGFEGDVTPRLDELAAESIVFENCFSQAPWTKPAIASMFTSVYPQVHGMTDHEGRYWGKSESTEVRTGILPDEAGTLAEALKDAGYRTAAFVANQWLDSDYGFAQGFDVYEDYHGDLFTPSSRIFEDARAWLDGLPDRDAPYLLYLHLMDVHSPYDAPQEDYDALVDSPTLGGSLEIPVQDVPTHGRHKTIELRARWANDQMRRDRLYWRARYASGIRELDRDIGGFVDWLQDGDRLDDALVMFTSDHGEELYDHLGWTHGNSLYDHQIRIPMIVRNPEGRQGGTRVTEIVELIDVMPTLFDVVGLPQSDAFQGQNFAPLLRGKSGDPDRTSFATATHMHPDLFSARTLHHKLIYDTNAGIRTLFDVAGDPGETRRITDDAVAARLQDAIAVHIAETTANGTYHLDTTEIPADTQERLKALGYLD